MDRGAWLATIHRVTKRLKQLSTTHDVTSVLGRKQLAAVILTMELEWSLKAKDINTLSVETLKSPQIANGGGYGENAYFTTAGISWMIPRWPRKVCPALSEAS